MSMDKTNEGRRVELVRCDDPHTKMHPGEKGTYRYCNETSIGVQHSIEWDSGSSLLLLGGIDSFKFIEDDR